MKNNEIISAAVATLDPITLHTICMAAYSEDRIKEAAATVICEGIDPVEAVESVFAANLFHSYKEWAKLGYQVKRGERAALNVSLWQYTDKPSKATRAALEAAGQPEPETDGHYYMAPAHLFSILQVEKAAPVQKLDIKAYNAMLAAQRKAKACA